MEYFNQVCESIDRNDALILCKMCQYGFHTDTCLTVPLDDNYDAENWICAACSVPPTFCQVLFPIVFLHFFQWPI
jgi:hypothetical protein